MTKKLIVNVMYGRDTLYLRGMMHGLASCLYKECDIPIIRLDEDKCWFETPNCIVRYVNRSEKLHGLRPDEIFGCTPEVRNWHRKPSDTLPWAGPMVDYIVEVEKAAAEEEKEPEQSREIDILEFLEWVIGSELTDIQRDMIKTFKKLHDDNCRVVYGRGGKIHVVPVEDKED